jgi:Phytochelatin synthase
MKPMPFILRLRQLVAVFSLVVASMATAQTLPLPPSLISLDSEAGTQLLLDSPARRAYWPLSLHFLTQKNQAYCGVASSVMVLNALGVKAPPAPGFEPFATFTQDNLLNERTELILPQQTLLRQGMTLTQLGLILESHGARVTVRHADDDGLDAFRSAASRQLATPGGHVIVNYLRRAIGQETGGHISPLAAYEARSDRFLILDVSRYKYPPVWVGAAELHAAMNTVDRDNDGRRRGYVLVGP